MNFFLFDSGARITVVPEKLEKEAESKVLVKDANGGLVERDLARVWIEVGNVAEFQKLVLVPRKKLEAVLLTMNMRGEKNF